MVVRRAGGFDAGERGRFDGLRQAILAKCQAANEVAASRESPLESPTFFFWQRERSWW
jgi:hypothetical protein